MQRLPSAAGLCFTYRDSTDLVRKLKSAVEVASRWRTVEQHQNERPAIVLGDHEEVIERWKQDAAAEHDKPDRVAERNHRQSIVSAMDAVLAAMELHQASISDRLRSERGNSGKSRGWTQCELDDIIRKLRADSAAKIGRLRRAIANGDMPARREATELYGRNALSRKFDAPRAMITGSTAWQELADYLGLRRGRKVRGGQQIGIDIAVEQASQEEHAREESVAMAWEQLHDQVPDEILASIREQLTQGDLTDEQARSAVSEYLARHPSNAGNHDRS